jgi:potassium-transporting ATPase A subunit
MTANGFVQIALYCVVVTLLVKPFGYYMTRVFNGERTFLSPLLRPCERVIYTVSGVNEREEQGWLAYGVAMLTFSLMGFLALYTLQRLQAVLPFNPQRLDAIGPDLAFNTSVSFVTNTNWQSYTPETTMRYLTQMAGLTMHNFVSAATGIALAIALIRGFARRLAKTIGNFWVDMTRAVLYVLLPVRRQHGGQGGTVRHRQFLPLHDHHDRRLLRCRQQYARQPAPARRHGAYGQYHARRDHLRRRRVGSLWDAALRDRRGLRGGLDGWPNPGISRQEDRGQGGQNGDPCHSHPALVDARLAVVVAPGLAGLANSGPHGFSEALYAYVSATGNNGSAFAGLSANTPFWNTTLGFAMWTGRFMFAVPMLAIAGSFAGKKISRPGSRPDRGTSRDARQQPILIAAQHCPGGVKARSLSETVAKKTKCFT